MNLKKRGFTLVELLSIIAILSLILIISTPIILNLIDSSRKNKFISDINGIIQAAKLEAETKYSGQYPIYIFENGVQKNEDFNTLQINGDLPQKGFIYFTDGLGEGVDIIEDDLYVVFAFISSDGKYFAYNKAGQKFTSEHIIATSSINYTIDASGKEVITDKNGNNIIMNKYISRTE